VLLWPGGAAGQYGLADADRGRLDRELDQAVESAKVWCRVVFACHRGGRRWAAIEARLLRAAALEWKSEPLWRT
jgi:hypothetical protein